MNSLNAPKIGTDVIVHWLDAHTGVQNEQSMEEIGAEELFTYKSRGILVRHDDKLVAVAADERSDGRYRGITYIPAILVHAIESRELKKPTRKRKPAPAPPAEDTPHAI